MSKKIYITIVILSLLLCWSIVFLWISICYWLTHQATKHDDWLELDLDDDRFSPYSEFVIEKI